MADSFPEEVLQHVLSFIDSHADRNSVSLVCRSWYEIERWCRRGVFIGNCYAASPQVLIRRFGSVRSLTIKGKPRSAEHNLVRDGWGAHSLPWISAMASAYPALEELRMKRMVVTDEVLELIASRFSNFKSLVVCRCEGFSTDGLASIAANCRNLRTLDLCDSEVDDHSGDWITHFPDSFTSLEFLNIDCLQSDLPYSTLGSLVARSPNLTTLRVNRALPLDKLADLLVLAPQLADLGTDSLMKEPCSGAYAKLAAALAGCERLMSLSGLWDVEPAYLPALYPVCSGLTFLNLRNATMQCPDLIRLLRHCVNLRRLWVLDYIEDSGLEEVATTCKDLQELRVLPFEPDEPNAALTEQGLVSVALGCPKLHYIVYFCLRMTNAALLTIAANRPNITCFRVIVVEPQLPDHLTHQPLDEGYGAIVQHCRDLNRLACASLVTDRLLECIGSFGKKLEMISLAFVGTSDDGLHYILSGCPNLRKLEVSYSPFNGNALLANGAELERMRWLWVVYCPVSYRACKLLGEKHLRLNVEVVDERAMPDSDECPVDILYVYRTVVGPRSDAPAYVWTTNHKGFEGKLIEFGVKNKKD